MSTPIGNLNDISQRAIGILQKVDIIAAEDTRKAAILKNEYGITSQLISLHDHNESSRSACLLKHLLAGENVALISDAGTPLISDPGYELVRQARLNGVTVSPIPGSCALIAALSASGLPADAFIFEGFPPAKKSARQSFFKRFEYEVRTAIFYESKHRVLNSIQDMAAVMGEHRGLVLARELTKIHETIVGDSIASVIEYLLKNPQEHLKGEFVLVLAGSDYHALIADEVKIRRYLSVLLDVLSVKDAAAVASKLIGCDKRAAYRLALAVKDDGRS